MLSLSHRMPLCGKPWKTPCLNCSNYWLRPVYRLGKPASATKDNPNRRLTNRPAMANAIRRVMPQAGPRSPAVSCRPPHAVGHPMRWSTPSPDNCGTLDQTPELASVRTLIRHDHIRPIAPQCDNLNRIVRACVCAPSQWQLLPVTHVDRSWPKTNPVQSPN